MNLAPSEEQQAVAATAHEFLRKELPISRLRELAANVDGSHSYNFLNGTNDPTRATSDPGSDHGAGGELHQAPRHPPGIAHPQRGGRGDGADDGGTQPASIKPSGSAKRRITAVPGMQRAAEEDHLVNVLSYAAVKWG